MSQILEKLLKEKDAIKSAPLSFVVAVFLCAGVIFGALFMFFKERLTAKDDLINYYREKAELTTQAGTGPSLTINDNTITPTHSIHHVSAGLLKNITVPPGFKSGTIFLIPDAIFTTDITGNIRNSFAASPGQVVLATYDGTKWNLLQSPFTDTGTALSTSRDIRTTGKIETFGAESGSVDLQDVSTGRVTTWAVGHEAPKGACKTGSLFVNVVGKGGTTLYVCEGDNWIAK